MISDNNIGENVGRGNYSSISHLQKEIFIREYEEGKTISDAATVANLKVSTAKTILYRYKRADEELIIKKRGGKRQEKITDEVLSFVENLVEHEPRITLKSIKTKLYEFKKIGVSTQTISNSMKKLKITLKKSPTEFEMVNDSRTLELRREYSIKLLKISAPLENREKIFFIDQIGFNLHVTRSHARSHSNRLTVRGRNITLITAISITGVVHYNTVHNSNCNSAKFCTFLTEFMDKLRTEYIQDAWVVMDNAVIHKSREVREIVNSGGAQLVFLPPHSPMLNPVRQVCSKVKLAARKILTERLGNIDIGDVINEGLHSISPQDCDMYVTNMLMKLPQTIERQPLY